MSKLIREELGKLLLREMEFGGALATITTVEVDKKMEHATINVSVIPTASGESVMHDLERHAGELQHLLNRKLNIKPMPRIVFKLDLGVENAALVEKILIEKDEDLS